MRISDWSSDVCSSELITVDGFSHLFSARAIRLQDRFGALIGMTVSGFLTWVTWDKAESTAEYGDITAMLGIPLAPFVYFMALRSEERRVGNECVRTGRSRVSPDH